MFDIGFGELLLVLVIGLVVLGPERLPVAVKTVAGWIRTLRALASTVQNELSQELKLQELQDSLKKVEKASLSNLSPELKASMDELKEAAESMRRGYIKPGEGGAVDAQVPPVTHQPLADAEAAHDGVLAVEQGAPTVPAPADAQSTLVPPVASEPTRPLPATLSSDKPAASVASPTMAPSQPRDDR